MDLHQDPPWDDPGWLEKQDNAWQRGLRLQQAWWRQERLGVPPGPRAEGTRLVVSMLPLGAGLAPNLMTQEARTFGPDRTRRPCPRWAARPDPEGQTEKESPVVTTALLQLVRIPR